jgi:hypothetical protein
VRLADFFNEGLKLVMSKQWKR